MRRGAAAGNAGNGSKWIRRAKRLRIYARDGWRCVWCGAAVADAPALRARLEANPLDSAARNKRLATLDHIVPRSHGGSNHAANLLTACARCNEERGDMPALSFAARLAEATHEVLERVLEAMDRPLPREEERAA